jgi:exopolysaccharide production protein ExoZ
LRGLAAFSVVVFHAFQWLDDQFWIGAAGVDVFFVISGFIIWIVSDGRESKPAAFAWRRFTRVAPAYWVMTLVVAAVALADRGFLPQVAVTARHLVLSLAFIQHTDPYGRAFPLLPPGWSLNYEAVFYLIVAAALFAPRELRLPIVVTALIGVCVLGFSDPPLYGLGANMIMLEFAVGAWLGRRYVLGLKVDPGAAVVLGGIGVAFLALLYLTGFHGGFWRELYRPFLWGGPAAMIVAAAVAVEQAGRIRVPRPLLVLGDASYAIYLCHLPATALVAHTLGVRPALLFVPAAAAVSLAAGLAFHAVVEKPLIAAARSLPTRLHVKAVRQLHAGME